METFDRILMEMYPTQHEEPIPQKRPIFSFVNHGNEKYSVNPRANILTLSSLYFLEKLCEITQAVLNIPLDQVTYVGNTPLAVRPLFLGAETTLTEAFSTLLIYADKWMKNVPVHERSHTYRLRFLNFMKKLKIQKTYYDDGKEVKTTSEYQSETKGLSNRYLAFIDRLEEIGKRDSIKGTLAREIALVASMPYLFASFLTKKMPFSYKIDEILAKFEAEMLTGIPGSKIPERTRNTLSCLYELRTDRHIPLNSMKKIIEKVNLSNSLRLDKKSLVELQKLETNDVEASPGFKSYLQNPPPIVPKYPQLENILTR